MKTKLIAFLCSVVAVARVSSAQGAFQNLDFESARLIFADPPVNGAIATTNALPGWSAYAGTNQLANTGYGVGGFFPVVSLASQTNFGSLGGFFSVLLGGGSISQTGLLPADANSLLFKARTLVLTGGLGVSLNDQALSLITILDVPDYTVDGADISAFAGQSATLKLIGSRVEIDDIQFSSQPIPEPSTLTLLFLAGGVIFYVRIRHWCLKASANVYD